ncbi:DegV family protein [Thermogemmatispora sp.]|uniref:DegV family protein n=1 Tax=Thermogemmatispora sp. TaxID=1968838 RepID=UPI001D9E4222|nr:DegV family protein [Thermogemmatispora sp.]MBX5450402.1 DegV family protein [Thermogemmatispora sp.]
MIGIVTDSTVGLPPTVAASLGITIVPLVILFDQEAVLDGVDLDSAALFRRLEAAPIFPHTSQPSPAAFVQAYSRLIAAGAEGILVIVLSSRLSGTYQTAHLARELLPDELRRVPIEIIDSQSAAIGMLPAVLQAAREARQGRTLVEIRAHAQEILARTHFLGVLDTLEFVRRNGRLNGVLATLGDLLDLKPILVLERGNIVAAGLARSRRRACRHIAQLVRTMRPIESIILGESSPGAADDLRRELQTIYSGELPLYPLGAALALNTGPGTAAVAVVSRSPLSMGTSWSAASERSA